MGNNMEVSGKEKNFFTRTITGITEFYEEYRAERPVTSKLVMLTIAGVLLAIILLFVHNQALHAKADSADDYQYVFSNILVRNPSITSAKTFFKEVLNPSTVEGYYQPLAMVSLMVDCTFGGGKNNLGVFHITSLIIHILNSFLVLLLFYLLFKKIWLAFIGGVLFGIHPVSIEEIAWLSERKSVLATLFLLLAIVLYILYVKSSKKKYMVISLVVFVLALLSKPIAVSLPFILLFLDYFWYKRLSFLAILEKIPYFVIAFVFSIIAYISQNNTAVLTNTLQKSSIMQIVSLVCYNNVFYLRKILIPLQLSPYYSPIEPISLANSVYLLSFIITILIIVFFIATWRWSKPLLLGYLIYLVSILPTSGIIKVTNAITCYKYAYFPSIGIFLCLLILINNISKLKKQQLLKYVVILTIIFSISIGEIATSNSYASKWQDTETLNTHILNINPNSPIILNACARTYILQGKFDKATEYLNKSLKIDPNYSLTYSYLGSSLSFQEMDAEAISAYNKALELGLPVLSNISQVYYNLGKIYEANNYIDDAKKYFEESIRLNPKNLNASFELAVILSRSGKFDEAVSICKNIIKDYPYSTSAYNFLGIIYAENEDYNEAITLLSYSLKLNPYDSFAYYTLGNILVNYGKFDEASMCYNEAVRLDPLNTNILNQCAKFYAQQGKYDDSINFLKKSIAVLANSEAYVLLGNVYSDIDKYEESIASYQKALEINPKIQDLQEKIDALKEKVQ